MQYIKSIFDVIDSFQALIVDQWGVLHNGKFLHPYTIQTLKKIKDHYKKEVIILSNSSRHAKNNAQLMMQLGIGSDLYTEIITSGDSLYLNLKNRPAPYDSLGKKVFILAWVDNETVMDTLPFYERVDTIEDADFLLVTGVHDQSLQSYPKILKQAKNKNLVMVIGNPDLKSVDHQGNVNLCPGTLMQMYKKIGGVVWANGKPVKEFYEPILKHYNLHPKNVLCIGDSLEHDIQGGNAIHASSVFITQGIFQKDLPLPLNYKDVEHLTNKFHIYPTYFTEYFQ